MKVVWNGDALDDLESIRAWIARERPWAAQYVLQDLVGRIVTLQTFPALGRIVPEYGRADLRELVIRPYRVVYRLDKSRISILRVWDGDLQRADREAIEHRTQLRRSSALPVRGRPHT